MRFVSLLLTLLVLAWVVLQQLGSGGTTAAHASTGSANAAIQAENRAKAVEAQVLQAAKQQSDALNRAENPAQAESAP